MGVKTNGGNSDGQEGVRTLKHSNTQVLFSQDILYGYFLYVNEKGVPKKLVRVIGVDSLSKYLTVEWIIGRSILTSNLEFSRYSLDGSYEDNWLETVPDGLGTGLIWNLKRFIARPFDPELIDPDFFP